MANNVVTISGMFGSGHTYFCDSPVIIKIEGLEWPDSSPFDIVRVNVKTPREEDDPVVQLTRLFPDSNAPFYDVDLGYIDGAEIRTVKGDGVTFQSLIVTSYSKGRTYTQSEDGFFNGVFHTEATKESIMETDKKHTKRIVDIESTQERIETLLTLCRQAYGPGGSYFADRLLGDFYADTGGQSSISFDVQSALSVLWSDFRFNEEIKQAQAAAEGTATDSTTAIRAMRDYVLEVSTEYISSDDGGVFTTTPCVDADGNTDIPGGQCVVGNLTEWERYTIGDMVNADVSSLEHTGVRNGDASTKPSSSPERVGRSSITSWVDVQQGYTKSIFYPASYNNGQGEADDVEGGSSGWTGHAPIVLRDSQDYVDFLFLNRRGAIETCSGMTKEAMSIDVEMKQYNRVETPAFQPSRSLMAIGSDGRRSWQMSSGYVTREWAEWWTMEFLGGKRKRWWMKYKGPGQSTATFVPVIVEAAKKSVSIYDKTKQQMPHVDFTVTLALEG